MKTIFRDQVAYIKMASYDDNRRPAILMETEDGQRITIATKNLPDSDIPEDCVAIKDYSENAGVLDALIFCGAVEQPHQVADNGYVIFHICKLSKELYEEYLKLKV